MKLKYVLFGIACFLILIAYVALAPSTKYANETNPINSSGLNEEQMLQELQPYQAIIDKINNESESPIRIFIPEDGIEKVYKNVIGTNLEEFEQDLRRYYQDALIVASRNKELDEIPPDSTASGSWIEGDVIFEISEDEANLSE